MQIVEFYRGDRGNHVGYTLENILSWSNGAWELDHDYIQWVLPSNEASMLNSEAPVMTPVEHELFKADPALSARVQDTFFKFLDFLGLKFEDGAVKSKTDTLPQILTFFNHNFLRITRCIKSMRLTNNEPLALALFEYLHVIKNDVSPNTWSFWHNAALGDLWLKPRWNEDGF